MQVPYILSFEDYFIVAEAAEVIEEKDYHVITKDAMQAIWKDKDLESKKQKALELIDKLQGKAKPAIIKLIDQIKATTSLDMIDKAMSNIMLSGAGVKVVESENNAPMCAKYISMALASVDDMSLADLKAKLIPDQIKNTQDFDKGLAYLVKNKYVHIDKDDDLVRLKDKSHLKFFKD